MIWRRRGRRRGGLRLRTRIIALFTLGGFLLSLLLAVSTYGFTRESLLNQRERTSTQTAVRNAQVMQTFLRG